MRCPTVILCCIVLSLACVRTVWAEQWFTYKATGLENSMNAEQLRKRAVLGLGRQEAKNTSKSPNVESHKFDTSSLDISWKKNSVQWSKPQNEEVKVDEDFSLRKSQKIRASTELLHSKNWKLKAGSELILKDRSTTGYDRKQDQPDSSLGLGMELEIDF